MGGPGVGWASLGNSNAGWVNNPFKHTDGRPHFHVYGTDVVAGEGSFSLPVDRGGRHVPTIEPEHTRIHEGVAFIHSHEHVVANDGIIDHLLIVPAGAFPHLRWWRFISTSAPAIVMVYRSPTVSDIGVAAEVLNLNENSSNTPNLDLQSAPVITDVGTEMYTDYIAGEKHQGGSPDKIISEIILKPALSYLIRYTNKSGIDADVNTNIFWYEPPTT